MKKYPLEVELLEDENDAHGWWSKGHQNPHKFCEMIKAHEQYEYMNNYAPEPQHVKIGYYRNVPMRDGWRYDWTLIPGPGAYPVTVLLFNDISIWNSYIQQRGISKELQKLRDRYNKLERQQIYADNSCVHPRAMKLMEKRKPFVVVAEDEQYYITVYQIIRAHERRYGTWTEEDENAYLIACQKAGLPVRLALTPALAVLEASPSEP